MSFTQGDVDFVADLKKTDEIWLVLIRRVRGWVANDHGIATRPYMIVLYEIAPNTILRGNKLLRKDVGQFPTPELVFKFLLKTMKKTLKEFNNQPPHRPQSIIFTSKPLYTALGKPLLDRLRISPKLWSEEENQGFGDEFIERYSKRLVESCDFAVGKSSLKQGLLQIPDVTPEALGSLYRIAADYYRARPWRKLAFQQFFTISWAKEIRYFVVSGAGGQEEGIGMESTWTDLQNLVNHDPQAASEVPSPAHNYTALLYVIEESLPFADLDAIERYGFEIARNPDQAEIRRVYKARAAANAERERRQKLAEEQPDVNLDDLEPIAEVHDDWANPFPYPVCFPSLPPKIEDMTRPSRRDLIWIEIAMKVIGDFAKNLTCNTLSINEGKPIFESNLLIPTSQGKVTVNMSHWPSRDHWDQVEPYLQKENERFNAPKCKVCGKHEDLAAGAVINKCGGCKEKLYCSRECQAKDWKNHKLVCKK